VTDVTDLAAKIKERCRRLDQVDQALAEMRRLVQQQGPEAIAITPRKQKRGRRQLSLPLLLQGRRKGLKRPA
jgi:hypothetical protein